MGCRGRRRRASRWITLSLSARRAVRTCGICGLHANRLFNATIATPFIHNDKDAIEAYTFHALCAGKIQLGALQQVVATNWPTAVHRLGLPPIPAGYRG